MNYNNKNKVENNIKPEHVLYPARTNISNEHSAISEFDVNRHPEEIGINGLANRCRLDAVAGAILDSGFAAPIADPFNSQSQSEEWPDPNEIHVQLQPVAEFNPTTLLSPVLMEWVMDEANRMPCPPDFIAAAALVALGSVIGARCAIKPKSNDSWVVLPNLWGSVVGPPAAKKSPAIAAGFSPLKQTAQEAKVEHGKKAQAQDLNEIVVKIQKNLLEDQLKKKLKNSKSDTDEISKLKEQLQAIMTTAPKPPKLDRLYTNDATVEKLGELLSDNPNGILVERDELVGLIAAMEREGREGDRAFYLEGWNGNSSFITDRIGRGTIFIPNLCLSVFGGIQPDKLVGYLGKATHALANDGMLQRLNILVYPDAKEWEWRNLVPNKIAREKAFGVFGALANLQLEQHGAIPADDSCKFPHFCFSDKGQELFIKWSHHLHIRVIPNEDNQLIAQHFTKFDKVFPAIALIFHLVDCVASGQHGPVTFKATEYAWSWCEYLMTHARRCYGLIADKGLLAAQSLATKLKNNKLPDGFTARDIMKKGWTHLSDDQTVDKALLWLVDEGWLRIAPPTSKNGRPTIRYFINPKSKKTK